MRKNGGMTPQAFQSTPLMRGETFQIKHLLKTEYISIHSPHARGDVKLPLMRMLSSAFQSTPLMRGETVHFTRSCTICTISIHSPHARGDQLEQYQVCRYQNFNPLPSCEGRLRRDMWTWPKFLFQSTPLMRGETFQLVCCHCPPGLFQSTPLMRGETISIPPFRQCKFISIHSPHARGDVFRRRAQYILCYFNPLPSCEGRRHSVATSLISLIISIHSPHARGDAMLAFHDFREFYFNPLPSCEGRRSASTRTAHRWSNFNPLPSCEGRPRRAQTAAASRDFNPLPSCEGRLILSQPP